VLDPAETDAALAAMHAHPAGGDAVVIGEITDKIGSTVALRTSFGGTRIVDMLVGDPLPRIC
jgi:hydrogenase expression/formation protein HypE